MQRYSWNELNEIFMLKLENSNVENAFATFTTQPSSLGYIRNIVALTFWQKSYRRAFDSLPLLPSEYTTRYEMQSNVKLI